MSSLKNTIIVTALSLLLLGVVAQFLNVDFVPKAKATTLFSDGFESGDFSAWTGTTGSPSIITNPVHNGTYAMNTTASNKYAYKTLAGQSEINASCYFRSNLVPDESGEEIGFIIGYADATAIFQGAVYYAAGGTRWRMCYRDGAAWSCENSDVKTINNDTWHHAKLYWVKNNSSGIVRLYINDTLEIEVTGKDTDDYGDFTQLRVGWFSGTSSGSESYVDDVWVGLEGEDGGEGALEPEIIGFSTATNGTSCTFRVKWNATGSHYIFGTNNTGSWQNDTAQACSGTWTNATKTLTSTVGDVVQWKYWINDTNGDWTSISTQNLTTVSVYSMGAVTGSASDIQTAINNVTASGDGEAYVPWGNFSWSVGDTVTYTGANDLNITGHSRAGCKGHEDSWENYTATTILHSNDYPPMANRMFYFGGQGHTPLVYGSVKVSNIQFEATPPANQSDESGPPSSCAVYLQQIPDFRVSYCTFINFCEKSICVSANDGDGAGANISCYGVVDHCYITLPYKTTDPDDTNWYWGYGVHVVGEGHSFTDDEPWDDTPEQYYGKYGYRRWFTIAYIEDCHFEYCRHHISSIHRGYYVARFNLFDKPACGYPAGAIDVHGASWPGGRGGEYYNNTVVGYPENKLPWPPYASEDSIGLRLRGGHNIVYNNTFTCDTYSVNNYFILLENEEDETFEYMYLNLTYVWDNTDTNCSFLQNDDPSTIREDIEYFLRAPNMTEDGFDYTPYPYPHYLTQDDSPPVILTITKPENTTYSSGTIPVELSASGGTIDTIWYNCWNGSWIYEENQTYTVPTNMENFVDDTYTFYAWANNTEGNSDQKTVSFTITITIQEWGSWWGYWW